MIPKRSQEEYLEIAKEYLDQGMISGIHLSTRPDGIDEEILDRLAYYGVDTIELGVQSFDEKVLATSKRGHSLSHIYHACELIKERGFRLGIQLMVGLPGDTLSSCLFSAKETARIRPELARIYPCLVLKNTELMDMYERGSYTPLSREEAILRTKAIYEILDDAGIYIMRIGLKSTDIINSENLGEINQGTYHPAFRQLVEGRIARERIEKELLPIIGRLDPSIEVSLAIHSHPAWVSNASGHGGENRAFFKEHYPKLYLEFKEDDTLAPGVFRVSLTK